jgi:hemerythrin-like domain-containing protein
MPVQIGAHTPSFTDPTGLLSDCHRRIEMFLKVLQEVAKVADGPLADEDNKSLDTALRYFREAAPKHTADEEESLFPRLRLMADPHVALLLCRLEPLEEDHRRATPLHARVEVLGQQWLKIGSLTPEEAEEFRALVAELAVTYCEHIHVEDSVVFPMAAELLSLEEKIAIGREMAGRRNVGSPVQPQNRSAR